MKENIRDEGKSAQKISNNIYKKESRQLRDKIVFTLNFILTLISIAVIFSKPTSFHIINTISVIIMMVHRVYEFFLYRWQFYLIDFCYLLNLTVILYTTFYRENFFLFLISFGFSLGPIFFAIMVYRFAFVFHNSVKMTSLWTHLSPCVTMFLIRWFDYENEFIGLENLNKFQFDLPFIIMYFKYCSYLYIPWAIFYYIIIFHVAYDYAIKNNCETQFLYYYTKRGEHDKKRLEQFGKNLKGIAFMLLHLQWVLCTLCIPIFFFFYFYLGAFIILVLTGISIWNASTYYIDYFSKHYSKQFEDSKNYEYPI